MLSSLYNKKTNTLTIKASDYWYKLTKEEILLVLKKNWYVVFVDDYKKPLIFTEYFNRQNFYSKISEYKFFDDFDEFDYGHKIPQNITRITFGRRFNCNIRERILHDDIVYIKFGHDFNTEIKEKILPKKLLELIFSDSFNQEIKPRVLPDSLEILRFGHNFNLVINKLAYPVNLRELEFGFRYDQSIVGLPKRLEILTLGHNFNSSIDKLPNTIKNVRFGENYSQVLDCSLINPNITKLHFAGSPNNYATIVNLPYHIEELILDTCVADITNLPIFLRKVKLLNPQDYLSGKSKISVPFGCKLVDKSNNKLE
jgi:hypothetical protein